MDALREEYEVLVRRWCTTPSLMNETALNVFAEEHPEAVHSFDHWVVRETIQ